MQKAKQKNLIVNRKAWRTKKAFNLRREGLWACNNRNDSPKFIVCNDSSFLTLRKANSVCGRRLLRVWLRNDKKAESTMLPRLVLLSTSPWNYEITIQSKEHERGSVWAHNSRLKPDCITFTQFFLLWLNKQRQSETLYASSQNSLAFDKKKVEKLKIVIDIIAL